jgi:hypothetical protein
MGKFEKGQYVRVLHTDYAEVLAVGDTFKVGEAYGHGAEPEGENKDLFFLNHELEQWVPKVGERVTVSASDVLAHWNAYWAETAGVRLNKDDLVYVTQVTPNYSAGKAGIKIAVKAGGKGPIWTVDRFSPALATLTIEAGKFYKTRDGRKVGPVTHNGYGVYGAPGFGGAKWYATGRSYSDEKTLPSDLVAEWVDEPKAGNDNVGIGSLIGKTVTVKIDKSKFNVGDRVNKTDWQSYSPKGYVVTKVASDGLWLDPGNGMAPVRYKLPDDEFWLVPAKPATKPAIVCLIENGQPKPSDRPHIHADEAKAGKEAARLAGVYKGKEFGVFVLTSSTSQPAPVYKHEWQRQAAAGNKISAIKELRAANDLTLKGAKDAVEHWLDFIAA